MYFCVKSGIFFFHFSSSLAWKTNIPEGFLLSEVSGIHWLPPKALNQTKVSLLDLMFHLYCYDYVGVCSKFRAWVWEEEGSYLESKVWAMWDALLIPWICQNETHSVRKKWDAVNTLLFHQFSLSVVSNLLWPHGLQHAMLPCPSPSPGACSNSCPLSWGCHPTISSSVVPFSSCLQSFPAPGSFLMTWLLTSGG